MGLIKNRQLKQLKFVVRCTAFWLFHYQAYKNVISLIVLTQDGRWVASRRVSLLGPGGEQRSLKDR